MAKPAHFTREHQRKARARVKRESLVAAGRAGAKATIAKHGYECLFVHSRAYRLRNPSMNELVIIGILAQLKIKKDREWRVGTSFYTVDFYLPKFHKAIEVKGRIHQVFEQEKRAQNEARKRELLAKQGVECLWIDYLEMADVSAVIERIRQFTEGNKNETQRSNAKRRAA
jgi:very-short-patch-repair endonuclease